MLFLLGMHWKRCGGLTTVTCQLISKFSCDFDFACCHSSEVLPLCYMATKCGNCVVSSRWLGRNSKRQSALPQLSLWKSYLQLLTCKRSSPICELFWRRTTPLARCLLSEISLVFLSVLISALPRDSDLMIWTLWRAVPQGLISSSTFLSRLLRIMMPLTQILKLLLARFAKLIHTSILYPGAQCSATHHVLRVRCMVSLQQCAACRSSNEW